MNYSYLEKVYQNGYNVINYTFIGGRCTICVVAYLPKVDKPPQFAITEIGERDEYNAILLTCQYGTKLPENVGNAFFPHLKTIARELMKKYPNRFLTNKHFNNE